MNQIFLRDRSMANNALREIRESLLMSKAELAYKSEVSPITVSRIEKGLPCRLETKRKIILALGFDLGNKKRYFSIKRISCCLVKKIK